jgi:shikimate dehydrogenase
MSLKKVSREECLYWKKSNRTTDMNISGKTMICGLIGDPVEHTMSPAMHNAAFKKLGLDYLYLAFRVRPAELNGAIAGMRGLNIRGLNVTIPHKVAVIKQVDRIDMLAGKMGAVNTIVNDNGVLTGYNTDAGGFLQQLIEKRVELKGKRVTILGAGGAARGIAFILAENGALLTIVNRNFEKAKDLVDNISGLFGRRCAAFELDEENLAEVVKKTDILVNATSVGMTPGIDDTPVPAALLKRGLIVYDIVYNPVRTRLLREAEAAGAVTMSGIDMLAWQGALAFEKFTGQKAPVDLMKEVAAKILGGSKKTKGIARRIKTKTPVKQTKKESRKVPGGPLKTGSTLPVQRKPPVKLTGGKSTKTVKSPRKIAVTVRSTKRKADVKLTKGKAVKTTGIPRKTGPARRK